MPMRVVDLLEVIEVDEHDGELIVVTLGAVNLRLQDETHMPRVVEGGAVIGDGEFMNALDVAGILKSDGRKIRKRFQKFEVTRVEAVRPHAVDQLNDAEAGVAKPDRD